jgi:hypothetical protein
VANTPFHPLEKQGISVKAQVHWNLGTAPLVEQAGAPRRRRMLRVDVRMVTELAWHGLFIRHLLRRPRARNWTALPRNGRSSTARRSRPIRPATAAAPIP